ncbi:hypothetical protein [Clostridium algidicarnis]|uniref:hypothetical protein n=1 Tax=Clostridium algidicarnis TaxID=37659 RepID=UPI003FD72542
MKDHLRDYATAAFRFYAKNGKSAENYKMKIYEEALENISRSEGGSGISKPTESAIMAAERAVNGKIAEIKDMEAVELTLAELRAKNRVDIVKAVEYVYFTEPEGEVDDIKTKVHTAELFIPASQRSIYYWLRQARQIFSIERGLRF